MAVTDIKEIRLLPALAIGRLGSSPEPLECYAAELPVVAQTDPPGIQSGYRTLKPAQTLSVDPASGAISGAATPTSVSFRDAAGRIKPVAPFLELYAQYTTDGPFLPLTLAELADLNLPPDAVKWDVAVGNLKMYRRTGDDPDRITAQVSAVQLTGHARRELRGTAANFRAGQSISMGFVQYIRPTAAFPEIRFRFTPAAGQVFGHRTNAVISQARVIYDPVQGRWDSFRDGVTTPNPNTPRAQFSTIPGGIYAQTGAGAPFGYFDDTCDGIVSVSITFAGRVLRSLARISAGPPAFAPDSLPVRSVDDELRQMAAGPTAANVTIEEVVGVMRRATETMRLMNTETQNREFPFWQADSQNSFGVNGARYGPVRGLHEGTLQVIAVGLARPADSQARRDAIAALQLVRDILRAPEDTNNYATTGGGARPPMQRMPAFMRGADGNLLSLTARQISVINRALVQFAAVAPLPPADNTRSGAMLRLIANFSSQAGKHIDVITASGQPLSTFFNPPGNLLAYLADPASLGVGDQAVADGRTGPLVKPRDPTNSEFFKMITDPNHPMNSRFTTYRDTLDNTLSGIDVVRNWINSL